ncbi:MAG: hypothetical protein ACYDDF_11095 [Thermoplasmatota archaeon]
MRWAWLLVLAFLAASVPNATASASSPSVLHWNGIVVLSVPFQVPFGTTLVIDPGTRVSTSSIRYDTPFSPDTVLGNSGYIEAFRRIIADGTASAPIHLSTNVSLIGAGASGSLFGIGTKPVRSPLSLPRLEELRGPWPLFAGSEPVRSGCRW